MAATPRLQVDHLTCAYDGRAVVHDVSFALSAGEVLCLLGPSGCGKSTVMRTIAGIERQQAGQIAADGRVLANDSVHLPPEDRRIGLIFQDFALFPHLTVAQNIAFGLSGSASENAERVATLLDRVNLSAYAGRAPHVLSGGEQQRVALARAVAPRPPIMLMDEPFSGLDNRLRDGIRDETLALLKEEGAAVVLVTHEPEEAMRMADKIALMRNGHIIQIGAPFEIYHNPVDREAAAFFSDINVIPGSAVNGSIETVFGKFPRPNSLTATKVEVAIRPQHIKVHGDGPHNTGDNGCSCQAARVERVRFVGQESLLEFRLETDGSTLSASVPGVFLPDPGSVYRLSLPQEHIHVFAAK